MPHRQALLVFVKNPVLGRVKTRLAAQIGDEAALAVYRKLLDATHRATVDLPVRKYLFYADAIDTDDPWEAHRYYKLVQRGADLGARMRAAFELILGEPGIERAVLIGSDCPELDAGLIMKAFVALETHEYVIGPAKDGGYYLVGMRRMTPELFQNKRWSTDTVLADSLDDLRGTGHRVYLLPERCDVDQVEDLPADFLDQIPGRHR
jgi:rSAM/selenodomain-associated transferase 1